ncbi:MAG: FtsX-like permease family protein [Kordiimonadaceae bacterium]|jgi:putative ABC transport system permease protein|nr:FtsX-like permease family protein [Kordiimonadaceae bacterium]MBT6031252.1 FtsX-like permease family protein [Kordiimonadaceae bacterium]
MGNILKALSSYLFRHPGQLALAIIGLAVGIAVIVAVDIANESARKSFDSSLTAVTGDATHQIIGGATGLDESVYIDLRLGGIRTIAPIVEGVVRIEGETYQLLGIDIFAETSFRDYQVEGSGSGGSSGAGGVFSLLTEDNGVLMMRRSAARLGLKTGDPFTARVFGAEHQGIVLSLMGDEESSNGLDRVLITDISVAQEWLGLVGKLSRIDVMIGDEDNLRASIEAKLPPDVQLLNAERRNNSLQEMSSGFNTSLTAMSLFALLVGVFLIYNCMSFMVLQRRPIIGVLRALGVTREQLVAALIIEGLVIATIGVLIGLFTGKFLGEQLVSLVSGNLSDHYYSVRGGEVTLAATTILKGVVAGLLATLIAVVVPAIEAVSYPPRLTLVRSVVEESVHNILGWLALAAGLLVIVAGVVLTFTDVNLIAGFFALFLVIVSSALLAPLVVKLMTPLLTIIMGYAVGLPGRIAVRGILKSLSRTGVAIAALTIAVAEIVGMGVMIGSFRENVEDWLITSLHSDIYVAAPARGGGLSLNGIDPELITKLSQVNGVSHYSGARGVKLETENGSIQLRAVDMSPDGGNAYDFLMGYPAEIWPAFNAGEGVIITDPYAYNFGLNIGDSLTLPTKLGSREFKVLGIYRDYNANQGSITINRSAYITYWQDEVISSLGIYLREDADEVAVIDQLNAVGAPYQALIIGSNKQIREMSLRVFDRTFIITNVLYWLAMIVAFVGVLAAALALSLERGKEIAILRALGMTRAQVSKLIVVQCGTMGLLAGLFALPVGMISGWLLINVINRRAFGWQIDMIIPIDTLLSALAIAIVTALIAAIYPAWYATKSAPVSTLREE